MIPEPTNYTRNFVDYYIKTPVLHMHIAKELLRKVKCRIRLVLPSVFVESAVKYILVIKPDKLIWLKDKVIE
jgi:hypothetical protein